MGVLLKIIDGTRPDKFLCPHCNNSVIKRGSQQTEEQITCVAQHGTPIPFRVVECNYYLERQDNPVILRSIRQQALYLHKTPDGAVHFLPFEQFDNEEFVERLNATHMPPNGDTPRPKVVRKCAIRNPRQRPLKNRRT